MYAIVEIKALVNSKPLTKVEDDRAIDQPFMPSCVWAFLSSTSHFKKNQISTKQHNMLVYTVATLFA